MKGKRTEWTAQMLETLASRFPTAYNKDIAKELGLGWRTIVRKARELGLEKENEFVKKRKDEILRMARKAAPPNPHKGDKQFRIKGGEAYQFKKGHTLRLSQESRERATATRNETIRREKIRLKYGLHQQTKMRIKNFY